MGRYAVWLPASVWSVLMPVRLLTDRLLERYATNPCAATYGLQYKPAIHEAARDAIVVALAMMRP